MNCIFCAIAAEDCPGHIIWHDQDVLVFLSLEGHPLIIPRSHVVSLADLDDKTGAAMMKASTKIASALRDETGCEGVNLVLSDGEAAGQDVFHLHLHVKPRWLHDNVVLTWDTATAPETERLNLAASLRSRLTAGFS